MTAQEPVHQYRLKGLSRWSDGIPPEGYLLEHVETRILYIAPPAPALSNAEILNCFSASKAEGMASYMLAVGRAIEAHCRGGAS